MSQLATALAEAIIAFTATNIDDIIILLLFFSQININFRRRHIIVGQYLGFILLVIASLPGFFGGLVVSREWIGLLGLLPIAIGIKQLVNREQETTEIQTITGEKSFFFSILSPQTYQVAAVTIANGGDNISIYIPLFAGKTPIGLLVILSVFFFMVGVWCVVAYLLTRQPTIAYVLSRVGKKVVPFVLIGLGLFIIYERGTFTLLGK
ncbi:MAG TPA: transporter [Cyanobacteria bacterium UBA11369]|nr:transporter [Cyanobacteria bacterium UBA11371]HBE33008.1 transporter [Cyanobacteria bacterium UBA11368]HBE50518.1 transporter [Cyanobacteria bacterium UBA11369]